MVATFTRATGGFNAATLGNTLRAVTGDAAQFTPRTMTSIVNSLKASGSTRDLQ